MKPIAEEQRETPPSCTDLTEWRREAGEACVVVTADDRVLPFASWEDATAFYRERALQLDGEIASARFFLCNEGEWTEVRTPEFAN